MKFSKIIAFVLVIIQSPLIAQTIHAVSPDKKLTSVSS